MVRLMAYTIRRRCSGEYRGDSLKSTPPEKDVPLPVTIKPFFGGARVNASNYAENFSTRSRLNAFAGGRATVATATSSILDNCTSDIAPKFLNAAGFYFDRYQFS